MQDITYHFAMKINFKISICFLASLLGFLQGFSMPARKGLISVTQADGATVDVILQGDERGHIYLTPDGQPLEWSDGMLVVSQRPQELLYEYNKSRETLSRALPSNLTSRFPGLMPGSAFPLTGSPRALVILVEYADVTMTTADPHDYFSRMLTQPGFSDYNATGSAIDYFTENSNGQFTPQFDVIGPVRLSRNRSYYGANGGITGGDLHPEEMILEACQLVDSDVDFSVYDTDGDGRIDNVFVFYAGRGENDGGGAQTIWPHASNVTLIGDYRFDGVQLDYYACTNEWQGSRPDGIGTFIHEFSHVMGLPDFYATDYTDAFTPGGWSVMDAGGYNNNSRTPPYYSAYERYALGWLTPTELPEGMDITLLPLNFNVGAIRNTGERDFYIIENRVREKWDAYIPGEGMLAWHVDYDPEVWYQNTVNNNARHQHVDIIEADGILSDRTRGGDCFPGTAGITELSLDGLNLSEINHTGNRITLTVSGEPSVKLPERPVISGSDGITDNSITLKWDNVPATHYFLSVIATDSRETIIENEYAGQDGEYTVTGLLPTTSYSFILTAISGVLSSEDSEPYTVSTIDRPWNERTATALPATDVTADSFTARWLPMDDADAYLLNVFTYVPGEITKNILDFTDGAQTLPEGWESSSTATYGMASWAGAATPSLRLGNDQDYVEFTHPGGITSLSFWHRGNGTGDNDKIIISVLNGDTWNTIEEIPVITAAGGKTTLIEGAAIEGSEGVRLAFNRTKGSLAIDDIEVTHPGTSVRNSVDGYPVSIENSDSYIVSGLAKGEYFYTVTALSDNVSTRESDEIAVGALAAVDIITTDIELTVNGLDVTVKGNHTTGGCTLHDIAGRNIEPVNAVNNMVQFSAPAPGVYILRAGDIAKKLIIK